jgi:hypothetical protein
MPIGMATAIVTLPFGAAQTELNEINRIKMGTSKKIELLKSFMISSIKI